MAYRGFSGVMRSGGSGGGTAFGGIPRPVATPPSIYQQASAANPNYAASLGAASGNILDELAGDIDQNELRDLAAQMGVNWGMPLTGGADTFSGRNALRLAESQQYQRRRQGLQDLLSLQGLLGSQALDPALKFGIDTQNSVWQSAPDPFLAHEQLFKDWERQYKLMNQNPAGGTRRVQGGDSGGIPGISYRGGGPSYTPYGGAWGPGAIPGGYNPGPIPVGSGSGVSRGPTDFYQPDFDWASWITGGTGARGATADNLQSDWDWMFGSGDFEDIVNAPDVWED